MEDEKFGVQTYDRENKKPVIKASIWNANNSLLGGGEADGAETGIENIKLHRIYFGRYRIDTCDIRGKADTYKAGILHFGR